MINKIKVVAFLVFLVFAIKLAGDLDNSYTSDCLVISSTNSKTVFKDWKENLWTYYSNDIYKVGEQYLAEAKEGN